MAAKLKGLYKTVNGEKVPVTAKEAKAYIMKQRGWTAEQYKKQYDIFKNKLRNYENFQRAHGEQVEAQSPTALLYKQARTMAREGKNYEKSFAMKRIESFTSVSSGTSKRQMEAYKEGKSIYYSNKTYKESKVGEYSKKDKAYLDSVKQRFEGFINRHPKAQELVEKIKNPVKLERALSDFADAMHLKKDKDGKIDTSSPFAIWDRAGQTNGSPDSSDFDITAYID